MKRAILGAAAAFAIVAPTAAHADTTGHIGAGYTNYEFDGGDSIDGININGAIATEASGFDVMFDARSAQLDSGGADVGFGYAAIHGGWQMGDHYFGGYVGMADIGVSGLGVGLEGQWHLDQLSFNADVGFTNFDSGGGDVDYTHLGVDGTFFFTPNFDVTANFGWGDVDDEDFTAYGLAGGWRPDGTDWSFELGYERGDADFGDVDTWKFGVVWDFGTDSRQDAARNGASRNGAERSFDHLIYAL